MESEGYFTLQDRVFDYPTVEKVIGFLILILNYPKMQALTNSIAEISVFHVASSG